MRRALETTPRSVPLFLLSAEAALAENDVRDAQEWLSKAQSIESSGAEVLALALKVQQAGGATTLSFEAAAVLADQAMRRGEAKKALSILAPLAEANPGREDVLLRVIQVAEAAGDTQTVIRWRSALVDAHKSMGRIGDAATGLRALLQLVPDSAEYRTRLAQLEPPARHDVDRLSPRAQPNDSGRPAARDEREAPAPLRGDERDSGASPVEPAAPIPPPPSFAPATPVAGAAEGEFILEFEDEQLVHEPGSTGPIPNAVRRLSQTMMTSFPSPAAAPVPVAPPLAPLPPLESLEPALEAETPPASPSLEDVGSSWSEAPRPAPRETDLEVETAIPADEFQVPVEPAAFPWQAEPGRAPRGGRAVSRSSSPAEAEPSVVPADAESIEPSGEALSAVELLAPVPEPEPPAEVSLAPDAIESALSEADVFRKYGLYDKAVDHLRGILKRAPDTLPLREKLFELALEGGRKNVAIAEAERLKSLYRTEGRDDRVSAIDALLVERTSAEMGEASDSDPGLPADPQGSSSARTAGSLASEPVGVPPAPAAPVEPRRRSLRRTSFSRSISASSRAWSWTRRRDFRRSSASSRGTLSSRGGGCASKGARPMTRGRLSGTSFRKTSSPFSTPSSGRALTDEMTSAAESAPPATPVQGPPAPPLDESSLFSDEQEFFNFAGELQTEMRQEAGPAAVPEVSGGDVPLEEIFREFKKGVEQQLSPEDYETHYNLGIAYKEMSLTDEAISEFQRAAKSPQYAVECCSMLGLCFLEKGLPQLAIKWYRKGLDTVGIREEDRLGLQYDLANLYADLGDRENAYRTFLEIYGSNASFRDVGERLKELAPA